MTKREGGLLALKGSCAALLLALTALACGSSDDSVFGNGTGDGGPGGDDGGVVDNPDGADFGDSGVVNTDSGLNACATDSQKGTLLPLDLYLMLDTSGSMTEMTSTNVTKWAAVKSALTGFVNDPASSGIGVGLQYFPYIANAAAPTTCADDTACGAYSPCIDNKACTGQNSLKFCASSTDCGGSACSNVGICHYTQNGQSYFCFANKDCGPLGPCDLNVFSYCSGRDSCSAADYATPAVPIGLLPGNATNITTSMGNHNPDGFTPTAGALQGAINEAKTYKTANPNDAVVAVLVTDGFPTECSPQDIPTISSSIAAAGLSGTPSVKTFVIGVFTQAEQASATANLNQIAAAGGTGQAIVINTSQNVTQQFQAALNQIRGQSLPCEFLLPVPEAGTPDYTKVNVQFTAGNGNVTVLPYVVDATGCDPTKGGWYYDADPAKGATPKKVELCKASCDAVKADGKGRVDIVQGCKTVVPGVK